MAKVFTIMELTETERQIIEILREARPYEVVEITKDKLGRPDFYLVIRTQKIIIHTESL